ncbi:microtubule-associated protein 9-like isoform X2 [Cimex lectularius]|uniref:Coiled-coil domain-containing protein n=2 Tax=Cimex lectularius TaxID=79782 RepID=A0A8I6RRD7_CIMLE|nr:microtubule-associated protein 9-like isoform X2 [Cimex lectularius]
MLRRSRTIKGDTFQEWKARKDMEARQSRLDALNDQRERMRKNELLDKEKLKKNESLERERIKKNEAIKTWLRAKQDSAKEPAKQILSEELNRCKGKVELSKEEQRVADITEFYACKKDTTLTFSQWLEKKEEDRLAKIREKEAKKLAREAEEREKQEQSKKAVNEWMVRTKYRTLTRHYPKLDAQEINNRIWQDLKI